MLSTTITDTLPQPADTESLKAKLHRAERINRLKSLGLILPLIIFLIVVF